MNSVLSKKYKLSACLIFGIMIIFLVLTNKAIAIETLLEYPEIGGQRLTGNTDLPSIIRYVYLFAIGICGAIALASILLGAIKYIGASGNPSKMGDAKDQIFSALLGVVILLSSYLILNTINPDLVSLNIDLTATTNLGGGRACYCVDSQGTDLFDTYSTPEECAALCADETAFWWGCGGSDCRAQ